MPLYYRYAAAAAIINKEMDVKKNWIFLIAATMTIASAASARDLSRKALPAAEMLQEIGITQYEVDSESAQIKSMLELRRHLNSDTQSPLRKMSSSSLADFTKSMVFTSYGLASYSFVPLQELSVSDAYAVLSLFGEQRAIGKVPGLRAVSRIEESMLFMSGAGSVTPMGEDDPPLTPQEPIPHQACYVDSSRTPPTWCAPHMGSMCNPRCKS